MAVINLKWNDARTKFPEELYMGVVKNGDTHHSVAIQTVREGPLSGGIVLMRALAFRGWLEYITQGTVLELVEGKTVVGTCEVLSLVDKDCKYHRTYKGLRKPRCFKGQGCLKCWEKYHDKMPTV